MQYRHFVPPQDMSLRFGSSCDWFDSSRQSADDAGSSKCEKPSKQSDGSSDDARYACAGARRSSLHAARGRPCSACPQRSAQRVGAACIFVGNSVVGKKGGTISVRVARSLVGCALVATSLERTKK
eukprot:COSAG03_NODE_8376_length_808_cov_24.356841_1_plen_125_part_10